jgi:long-chain acyl-CoA synthetase
MGPVFGILPGEMMSDLAGQSWAAQAWVARDDTLPAMFARSAARFADRPAIQFMGRIWLYRDLAALADKAAAGLQRLGVTHGTRVGLCLPNTPYSVIFYYAVLRAGGIVVNYNPLYVERELAHQIKDSGTTIMVVPDLEMICAKLRAIIGDCGLQTVIVCPMAGVLPPLKALLYKLARRKEIARNAGDRRFMRYRDLIAGAGAPGKVAIDPEVDIAVLQYTGGTTGTPKGAMLTHRNLCANCQQVEAHMPGVLVPGQERMLAVLPFFHVFAMTAVMNFSIAIGAEMILHPRFVLADVMDAITRLRPTLFHAVPTIYVAINAEAGKRTCDLTSLKACISGGAPLPGEVRERFERLTGCHLVEGYGLSEASPVVCCGRLDGAAKPNSVGVPVAGTTIEIRAIDDPSRRMPRGERGEICVRGPQVMAGYWKRPEETAAVFHDGALRTGDVGYVDAEGYIFITDRLKDVILCSGYNVYPRVIEEALYQHKAVAEAVVIGVPDAYRGQAPKAFVTLAPGAAATPEELLGFLTDYVSKIEMPKAVVIRDSLPKTMIGKLSKKELIAEELGNT